MKDLNHLVDLLERLLSDLTNREPPNTPVIQHYSQPGLDMDQLNQLLVKLIHDGYSSVRRLDAIEPTQSCFAGDEQGENIQAAEVLDLQGPVLTTPNDFNSFEKWASHASAPQFKTVMEMYEPPGSLF